MSSSKIVRRSLSLFRLYASRGLARAGPMEIVPVHDPTCTFQPCVAGAGEGEMPRDQGIRPFSAAKARKFNPPSQLEVVLFWIVGMVTTILSGAVAIYASHYHLWN
jgi:hypothetical protein